MKKLKGHVCVQFSHLNASKYPKVLLLQIFWGKKKKERKISFLKVSFQIVWKNCLQSLRPGKRLKVMTGSSPFKLYIALIFCVFKKCITIFYMNRGEKRPLLLSPSHAQVCLVRQPLGALPTPCITRDLVTCFPD
jgi:hypothetical protein